jgi:hypothetical protein
MLEEHHIGQLAEGFGCLPSEIIRERRRMPVGYLEDVLLYRHFAKAWQVFNEAEDKDKLPDHPLIQVCMELWYERAGEQLKAHRQKGGPKQ